jgi:hypothetical protein
MTFFDISLCKKKKSFHVIFKPLVWNFLKVQSECISLIQRMADMKKRTEEDKQREMAFFVSLFN